MAMQHLNADNIDGDSVIEGDPAQAGLGESHVDRSTEMVTIREHQPGRVLIDVECAAPALLRYLGNDANGWKAMVDGRPREILPANIWMRAIPGDEGMHHLEIVYAPDSFRWVAIWRRCQRQPSPSDAECRLSVAGSECDVPQLMHEDHEPLRSGNQLMNPCGGRIGDRQIAAVDKKALAGVDTHRTEVSVE